jgi:hypothetical protein
MQVQVRGFTTSTFPPYLSSPVWPTAPITPAPKFVVMPQNVRFVPEYNWGCPEDMPDPNCPCNWSDEQIEAAYHSDLGAYGASEASKRRARRKSAKLRAKAKKQKSGEKRKKLIARAIAVEKKAGIYKPKKKVSLKSAVKGKAPTATQKAEVEAEQEETAAEKLVDSGQVTEPEGVPQDAQEGASNMRLIIGGTLALMAAIGIGFAITQSKKKSQAQAAAPALPAPAPVAAPAPAPAPAPAVVAAPAVDEDMALPNPRMGGRVFLIPVRSRR